MLHRRKEIVQILIVACATAIGAELKIYPFTGDTFRIGLGVSVFLLFFLLFMRHLNLLWTGIVTGITSSICQTAGWMLSNHNFSIAEGLQNNIAAGIYYIVYAAGLKLVLRRTDRMHPLLLGGIVTMIDFISNEMELLLRGLLSGSDQFHMYQWFNLLLIALVRSYFVIGLYNSISVNQMRVLHAEQEKRMEQMLHVGTGLYGETFYLKKSMDTIEQITADSFDLYRKLKNEQLAAYYPQALGIAQQIHEVKKDSQRILAGLMKLYDSELAVDMDVDEIVQHVVKGNQKYSHMLGKKVTFHKEINVQLVTTHYVALLTVLNNLAANAVEAIPHVGTIGIHAYEADEYILFTVVDTGKGITDQDRDIIFEAGYTTKYDEEGLAATGIGLSHVRDIVQALGGNIRVESEPLGGGCSFTVQLPRCAIV